VFLLSGIVFGVLALISQSAPQSDLALVPVRAILTVEARHGNHATIPALNRDDVMAYEQKERLRVTDLVPFAAPNDGLDLFLLLDDASSSSLGSQLGDLRQFIQTQSAATNVGLGYMHNGTVDIIQSCTNDHDRTAKGLRLPLGFGGVSPSPYLSLSDLIREWRGTAARREIVMVTSGIDPLGGFGAINPYLDAAIDDAQRSGIVIYAIYMPAAGHGGHSFFRMNWGQNHLAELAEDTGGEAYMLGLDTPIVFAPYLNEISGHLSNQYVATVLMKAQKKAGFRHVRFTTEVPNAEIVAAARVYAPAGSGRKTE
ncbi:MAG TPA: hypothetical protein VHC90_19630, partial [Bryobacteraceae bacterium]|nr:hypothetical protein [Bryobacteraceae bacterium]